MTQVTKGNSPPKSSLSFVFPMMVPYYEKRKSDQIIVDLSNSATLSFLGVLKLESNHRRTLQRLRNKASRDIARHWPSEAGKSIADREVTKKQRPYQLPQDSTWPKRV